MATVPAEVQGPSDAELIDAVRSGALDAYGSLYERHSAAAYNLARQLARSQTEQDDLVSEAFEKVLATLKTGRGPDSAFRAYLLTALRHTAYDKTRRDRRIELSDDIGEATGVRAEAVSVPFTDPAVTGLERSLAAKAFARLPERWQAVLWHTEIEGQSAAEVAPILGLTPNGVSALAYRAREGLKQAYLQVHLAETTEQRCRATADRLGAWTRGGLSKREKAQVEAHLDECVRCRALAAELADVNGSLRIFIAPLVLGSGTVGYLATTTAASVGAVTGGVAAVGAAGAVGVAGSGGSGAGAAGAGASLPRQFLGVAASATALAAAIAVALAAGGTQEIPQARQTPQPTAQPPATPGTPASPAPPTQPPVTTPPPSEQPAPTTTTPPPPAPGQQPAPPNLVASSPGMPISLVAGGDPVDLPLTVRNNGGSVSGPVQAVLALPAGVSAIAAGPSRFGAPPLLRLNGAQPPPATVFCPAGTGTVTCGTSAGLEPGGSVTLLFRLVAAAGSAGGEITGSVGDGIGVSVRVAVTVVVRPPDLTDGVDVRAKADWFGTLLPGLLGKRLVHITATNTGTSTKPITVTIDQPGVGLIAASEATCDISIHSTSCTTDPVAPGENVRLTIRLNTGLLGLHCPDGLITTTAVLGEASDSASAKVDCWFLSGLPGLGPPATPHPPSTTQTPPKPPAPPRPPTKPELRDPATTTPPTPSPTSSADPPPPATPAPPPEPAPEVAPHPDEKDPLPPRPRPSLLRWLLG